MGQVITEDLSLVSEPQKEFLMSDTGGFFSAQDSENKGFIDKKIVTSLNALTIVAFAKSAKSLGDAKFLEIAVKTEEYLYNNF